MSSIKKFFITNSFSILLIVTQTIFSAYIYSLPEWLGWSPGLIQKLIFGFTTLPLFLSFNSRIKEKASSILSIALLLEVISFLIIGQSDFIFLAMIFGFTFMTLSFKATHKLLENFKISYFQAGIFHLLLLSYITYISAFTKTLTPLYFYTILFLHSLMFIYGVNKTAKNLKSLRVESSHYLLAQVLFLAFIASSTFQTYADTVVFRLPYLNDLLLNKGLSDNLMASFRVMPQFDLMSAVNFYFFGNEQLASVHYIVIAFLFYGISSQFISKLSERSELQSQLISILIISLPIVWIIIPNMYIDITMLTYLIAGLTLFEEFKEGKTSLSKQLLLGLLLGTSVTIKLNAIMIILPYFIFSASSILRKERITSFLKIIIVMLIPYCLWSVYSYLQTGNPIFPILSKKLSPIYAAEFFNREEREVFNFKLTPLTFFILPAYITFKTNLFGEYLRGTLGLIPLLSSLILPISLYQNSKKKNVIVWIVTGTSAILLTWISIKLVWIRYLLPTFVIFIAITFKGRIRYLNDRFFLTVAIISITHLTLFGIRLNYQLDKGIGENIFRNSENRKSFYKSKSFNIDIFINDHLKEGESFISTGFQYMNLINKKGYYLTKRSNLGGIIKDKKLFQHFIEKNNVKYWIIDKSNIIKDIHLSEVANDFMTEGRIVYGGGPFFIYSLEKETHKSHQPNAVSLTNLSPNIYKLNTSDIGSLRVIANIKSNNSQANILIDYECLSNPTNFQRRIDGVLSKEHFAKYDRFFNIEKSCTELKISIRPWQDADGEISTVDLLIYPY